MLLHKQETVHWKYIMFANDTNLFYQHKDINELFRVIISELEKVCDWSHANKLTKWRKDNIYIYIIYIFMKNRDNIPLKLPPLFLNKKEINKVLGIQFDESLNWNEHLNAMENKVPENIDIDKLKKS